MARRAFHGRVLGWALGVLLFLTGTAAAAGIGDAAHLSGWLLDRAGYGLNASLVVITGFFIAMYS